MVLFILSHIDDFQRVAHLASEIKNNSFSFIATMGDHEDIDNNYISWQYQQKYLDQLADQFGFAYTVGFSGRQHYNNLDKNKQQKIIQKIYNVIKDVDPKVIICPSFDYQYPDREIVAKATKTAILKLNFNGTVLNY